MLPKLIKNGVLMFYGDAGTFIRDGKNDIHPNLAGATNNRPGIRELNGIIHKINKYLEQLLSISHNHG
ncbi:MAG: hypothetical protein CSYNP_04476 [Syntrophus sp. SKADARSKE-3]|nr:hypothetical protein [Syntrophus sp. SKADARSKE-3]